MCWIIYNDILLNNRLISKKKYCRKAMICGCFIPRPSHHRFRRCHNHPLLPNWNFGLHSFPTNCIDQFWHRPHRTVEIGGRKGWNKKSKKFQKKWPVNEDLKCAYVIFDQKFDFCGYTNIIMHYYVYNVPQFFVCKTWQITVGKSFIRNCCDCRLALLTRIHGTNSCCKQNWWILTTTNP